MALRVADAALRVRTMLYAGRYGPYALRDWAERLAARRAERRDAYVYFDNDVKCAAPADAQALIALTEA